MEEKERYEYFFGTNTIKDNKTSQFYDCVVDLLNQQDKRIKELELYIKSKENCNEWLTMADNENLQKENQQLKQTIQTIHQNVRNSSLEDIKYIETLKEEIEDWQEAYQQLKQQLLYLSKQIVEEIRNGFNEKIKDNGFNSSYGIDLFWLNNFLDTILKKYGGKNE